MNALNSRFRTKSAPSLGRVAHPVRTSMSETASDKNPGHVFSIALSEVGVTQQTIASVE
jgi:hypothetical protein